MFLSAWVSSYSAWETHGFHTHLLTFLNLIPPCYLGCGGRTSTKLTGRRNICKENLSLSENKLMTQLCGSHLCLWIYSLLLKLSNFKSSKVVIYYYWHLYGTLHRDILISLSPHGLCLRMNQKCRVLCVKSHFNCTQNSLQRLNVGKVEIRFNICSYDDKMHFLSKVSSTHALSLKTHSSVLSHCTTWAFPARKVLLP